MKKKPMHGTGEPSRQNLPDDPEQSKRFEETARELEAEERKEKFDEVVKGILPAKSQSKSAGQR